MDTTSLQAPSFTPEQRAEFAETYLSGLDSARPVNSCLIVPCDGVSTQVVEHAAIPAIHSMIENA